MADRSRPVAIPKIRAPFKITGVLDLETYDWSSYAVAAIYDGSTHRVFYDGDQLIDYLMIRGGVWFSHAGGTFDMLYVLDRCLDRGIKCQVDRAQSRITRIVIGKLQLRDSYSLWPVPLDDICGALGRETPALPWPCICPRKCGGFCQIGRRAAQGDPDLEDYCIADCKALYDGIKLLQAFSVEHKIPLRGTMGQTAWVNAQTDLGVPDSEITWEAWRYLRKGDYGGRTAIVRPRAKGPGSHHDICNAYPAQLARAELPVGDCEGLGRRGATDALEECKPGLYTLTVKVPEDLFFPPLPWRHGGVVSFPVGEITGTWTLPELVAAFERGTSVVHVHSAMTWEATAPIFAGLIDRWYEIRRDVGRKTPLGQWIGRLAKSLTGKFAERPEKQRVVMHPDEISVCMRVGRCRNGCTKRCGAYEQVDIMGNIWAVPYAHLGASTYPQWSSYLRAMTRVQWLEQAERFHSDVVFGNTDSLFTLGRASPAPLGDGLGQWEYQGAWSKLDVRSPGAYSYRDEHGAFHARGVPGLTPADWKRGAGLIERGIVTFQQAAKGNRGLFTKRHRRWTLPQSDRLIYGDRKVGAGGITYPMHADELRELARSKRVNAMKRLADLEARRVLAAEIDEDADEQVKIDEPAAMAQVA